MSSAPFLSGPALFLCGSAFFPCALIVSRLALLRTLGCSQSDAVIAATRFVSSLQSVMASTAGVIIVSSCSDLIHDRHWLAESYVIFATPYFVYDLFAMFLCYRHKLQVKGQGAEPESKCRDLIGFLRKETLLVLHHIFMVVFCFPASVFWRGGKGDFFQGVLLLPELSTPFLCLGKVLIQFDRQDSLLHKINGVLVIVTFFVCRVLLFPYMYYRYSSFAAVPLLSVLHSAPWQCNLIAALLWPLQLHWFRLLCKAAVRAVSKGGRHRQELQPNGTKAHSN